MVHSRICDKLPGIASTLSVASVCIESIINNFGSSARECSSTVSNEFPERNKQSSFSAPSLCARILICDTLSSETYNTFPQRLCKANCNTNVDLPIPGSPPSRIIDPGTMPPPNTRFSSPSPVSIRSSAFAFTSDNFKGREELAPTIEATRFPLVETSTSSTKLFHSPQVEHFPTHLDSFAPQF